MKVLFSATDKKSSIFANQKFSFPEFEPSKGVINQLQLLLIVNQNLIINNK